MTEPTESAPEDALARIETQLADLTDLFRRRLFDDRDKRRLIDSLAEQARGAELGAFRQYLHPVVLGVAMVIDRLDAYQGPDPQTAESIREELLDVLGRHGVSPVDAQGPVDPRLHEVVAIDGPARQHMVVASVQARGYRHGDWVFRPARVVAAPEPEGVEP